MEKNVTPRGFKKQVAQGDLLLTKVSGLPEGMEEVPLAKGTSQHVVAHSETGHHHVVRGGETTYYKDPSDPLTAYLVVKEPATLEHLRSFDTHGPIAISEGVFKLRRQREHSPEGWRMVED